MNNASHHELVRVTVRTFEVGDGRGGVAAAEPRAGDERGADGDQLQVMPPGCPPRCLLRCRLAKCEPQLERWITSLVGSIFQQKKLEYYLLVCASVANASTVAEGLRFQQFSTTLPPPPNPEETHTTTKTAFCPGSIWPFVPVLEPGFGRRDKSAGGFCPGW